LTARIDGEGLRWHCHADARRVFVHDGDRRWILARLPVYQSEMDERGSGGDRLQAPMPGRIVLWRVAAGDAVDAGQELGVMEAMKMELSLKSPRAGRVAAIQAGVGDFVDADAVLVRLEDAS
jgi:3-methylcrotonyl-CoA carboxylase alpha subunit